MNTYLVSYMILQQPDTHTTNISYGDTVFEHRGLLSPNGLKILRKNLSIEFMTTPDKVTFLNVYKFQTEEHRTND